MKFLKDVNCSIKYLYSEVQYPVRPLVFLITFCTVAASDGTRHAVFKHGVETQICRRHFDPQNNIISWIRQLKQIFWTFILGDL